MACLKATWRFGRKYLHRRTWDIVTTMLITIILNPYSIVTLGIPWCWGWQAYSYFLVMDIRTRWSRSYRCSRWSCRMCMGHWCRIPSYLDLITSRSCKWCWRSSWASYKVWTIGDDSLELRCIVSSCITSYILYLKTCKGQLSIGISFSWCGRNQRCCWIYNRLTSGVLVAYLYLGMVKQGRYILMHCSCRKVFVSGASVYRELIVRMRKPWSSRRIEVRDSYRQSVLITCWAITSICTWGIGYSKGISSLMLAVTKVTQSISIGWYIYFTTCRLIGNCKLKWQARESCPPPYIRRTCYIKVTFLKVKFYFTGAWERSRYIPFLYVTS